MASPYERVLGASLARLDPHLRAYFAEIPAGSVGVGSGTFDVVGTPYRGLRPVFRAIGDGALFATRATAVPFTVRNVPDGDGAVRAERRVVLPEGASVMRDRIQAAGTGLVDRIGAPERLRASFSASVVGGALVLDSVRVALVRGRAVLWMPRAIAPRIRLVERWDAERARQHVRITVTVPVLGVVYEYAGHFAYAIEPATAGGGGDA